uniref:Uncharacterized protein n=1 Tax=Tetranychus urticae TaxID=32264 RepID=T1KFF0_TETUR
MSFVITYIFVGSSAKKRSNFKPDANGGATPNVKKIPVELRGIKPPVDVAIDPVVLDCITTEVYHSRVLMDHSISLYASLPTWLTDYWNLNETKNLMPGGRERGSILTLFIQITSDATKFGEMLKNVDFKEISERQKYLLEKDHQ